MGSWAERLIEYLERDGDQALAGFLPRQRWFGAKGRLIAQVRLLDCAALPSTSLPTVLTIVSVEFNDGPSVRYFLPLVVVPRAKTDAESAPDALFALPNETEEVTVYEATAQTDPCLILLDGIRNGDEWHGHRGLFRCLPSIAAPAAFSIPTRHAKRLSGEQSNTSILFDRQLILKVIRKVDAGINPDREMLDFLTTRARYPSVPALIGSIEYHGALDSTSSAECSATVALLQSFIPNDGDAWTTTLQQLQALLHDGRIVQGQGQTEFDLDRIVEHLSDDDARAMVKLGTITAELHTALASDSTDPAFRPERISQEDLSQWQSGMRAQIHTVFGHLRALNRTHLADLQLAEDGLNKLEFRAARTVEDLRTLLDHPVMKIRVHGDYHLGQVLKAGQDFVILDFEGEPARRLEERRAKQCALKDVAGMLRSFNYARHAARRESKTGSPVDERVTAAWERLVRDAFWTGYTTIAKPGHASFMPGTQANAEQVLHVFELDKTIYELGYELNNRPDWIDIPLQELRRILAEC